MVWGLEWGSQLQMLLDIQEFSGKVPKALESKPSLDGRQQFYYNIFAELSGDRGRDEHGLMRISMLEVLAYCTFYGINDIEQRTTLARFVRALDAAYLEELARKKDKEPKS